MFTRVNSLSLCFLSQPIEIETADKAKTRKSEHKFRVCWVLGASSSLECRFTDNFQFYFHDNSICLRYLSVCFVSQKISNLLANSPVRKTAKSTPADIKTFFILVSLFNESDTRFPIRMTF